MLRYGLDLLGFRCMKKNFHKQPAASEAKSGRKAPANVKRPAAVQRDQGADSAERVRAGTEELHEKAHLLDLRADALHASIRATHQAASQLHSPSAQPLSGSDAQEIVIDDTPWRKSQPFTIVGIGASAGGYEASAEFLLHMPVDTGMAFVLVQHLDPKYKSQLTQLLAQGTKLPVLLAANEMEVEPNRL